MCTGRAVTLEEQYEAVERMLGWMEAAQMPEILQAEDCKHLPRAAYVTFARRLTADERTRLSGLNLQVRHQSTRVSERYLIQFVATPDDEM